MDNTSASRHWNLLAWLCRYSGHSLSYLLSLDETQLDALAARLRAALESA